MPSVLGAVGLAHDIGNPPFGHQGENAIRAWFKRNKEHLWGDQVDTKEVDIRALTEQHKQDFLKFEGNAQTLRVLSKLQVIGDDLGLNLTMGTLAALMKYVAPSHETDSSSHPLKKVGYFVTEQSLVETIRKETGLKANMRHPLALVMEACDDLAYSVLDAEDAIKKGLVSFNDLLAWLNVHSDSKDEVVKYVSESAEWEHKELLKAKLPPDELIDVSTQKFRVHAIHAMVSAVVLAFNNHFDDIMRGAFHGELIKESKAASLCSALKKFDRENAFSHRSVIEVELNGFNTINQLMDFLWIGITKREDYQEPSSKRTSPFAAYAYSRISKNYRRVFEDKVKRYHQDDLPPIRYREMQLLTDMVSGMTDQFCIELHNDLKKHYVEMRTIDPTAT